jgi:signal transduction histidine kinase
MATAAVRISNFDFVRDRLAVDIGVRLFALALAIAVGTTWFAGRADREAERVNQEKIVSTFLDAISEPLSTAVWRLDVDQTQQFVDAIAALPMVAHVSVDILGARTRTVNPTRPKVGELAGENSIVRELLGEGGEDRVGRVIVFLDRRDIDKQADARLFAGLQANLFVVFLVAFATFALVYVRLSLPLRRLAVALSQLGSNGARAERLQDAALAAAARRRDSIGIVASALQSLYASLSGAMEKIEQANATLESQVAERTRQLAANENILTTALEAMDAAVSIYGPDEKLFEWNDKYVDFFPATAPVLRIGAPATEIFSILQSQGNVSANLSASFALRPGVYERKASDGRRLRTTIREIDGGGYVTVSVDLTELKTALENAELSVALMDEAIRSFNLAYSVYSPEEKLVDFSFGADDKGPLRDPRVHVGTPFSTVVELARDYGFVEAEQGTTLVDGLPWGSDLPLSRRVGQWDRPMQNGRYLRTNVTKRQTGGYIVVTADITEIQEARRQAEVSAEIAQSAILSVGAAYSAWSSDGKLIKWSTTLPGDKAFEGVQKGMAWEEFVEGLRLRTPGNVVGETLLPDGRGWFDDILLRDRVGVWEREKTNGRFYRSTVAQLKSGIFTVITQDLSGLHAARREAELNGEIMREAIDALGVICTIWNEHGFLRHIGRSDPNDPRMAFAIYPTRGTSFKTLQDAIQKKRGGEEIADKSTLRDGLPLSRQPDIADAVGVWDRRFPDGGYERTTVRPLKTGEYLLVTIDLTEVDIARRKAFEAVEVVQEVMNNAVQSFGVYDSQERLTLRGRRVAHNTGLPLGSYYREILEKRRASGLAETGERSTRRGGKTYLDYSPLSERVGVWERYLSDGRYWQTKIIKLSAGGFAVFTMDLTDMYKANEALAKNEKMAALGEMVAGVAHEANTPIGIAVTASSLHADDISEMGKAFREKRLSTKIFEDFLARGMDTMSLLGRNLHRAAALISKFKQVSVDQTSDMRRKFELRSYVKEVCETMAMTTRTSNVVVKVVGDEIEVDSYPGAIAQIVTNLVMNAIYHAFAGRETQGKIKFKVLRVEPESVRLTYIDDGVGMSPETLRKVFEPFFTTKRGSGGTGLGMTIVHNLIVDRLGGAIDVKSKLGGGVKMAIVFPIVAPVALSDR